MHSFPATPHKQEAHIIKTSDAIAMHPMTVEEAVKEAEFRDRHVFVFREKKSGRTTVLHRRNDGKVELIEGYNEILLTGSRIVDTHAAYADEYVTTTYANSEGAYIVEERPMITVHLGATARSLSFEGSKPDIEVLQRAVSALFQRLARGREINLLDGRRACGDELGRELGEILL